MQNPTQAPDGVPEFGSSCGTSPGIWEFPVGTIKADTDEEINAVYHSLECAACHQFPKGNIYACKERHIVCESCLPESRVCPGCHGVISEEESFVAETLTNFTIPCKYKFHGCQEMIRGENVRDHLASCTYRPIPCIMAKCTESIPFKQLFQHLLDSHGPKVNGVTDCSKHTVEWWIDGDTHSAARWPPFYFTAFDNVFLYMCASTKHGTWAWMWILANDEEASRFIVETKMENAENGMGVVWRGPVHSIRKHVRDVIASGQVFVANSKEIANPFLFRKGNDGKSFFRTEVQIHQIIPSSLTSTPYLTTNDPDKLFLSKAKDSWAFEVDKRTAETQENNGIAAIEEKPKISQMHIENSFEKPQEETDITSSPERELDSFATPPKVSTDAEEVAPAPPSKPEETEPRMTADEVEQEKGNSTKTSRVIVTEKPQDEKPQISQMQIEDHTEKTPEPGAERKLDSIVTPPELLTHTEEEGTVSNTTNSNEDPIIQHEQSSKLDKTEPPMNMMAPGEVEEEKANSIKTSRITVTDEKPISQMHIEDSTEKPQEKTYKDIESGAENKLDSIVTPPESLTHTEEESPVSNSTNLNEDPIIQREPSSKLYETEPSMAPGEVEQEKGNSTKTSRITVSDEKPQISQIHIDDVTKKTSEESDKVNASDTKLDSAVTKKVAPVAPATNTNKNGLIQEKSFSEQDTIELRNPQMPSAEMEQEKVIPSKSSRITNIEVLPMESDKTAYNSEVEPEFLDEEVSSTEPLKSENDAPQSSQEK